MPGYRKASTPNIVPTAIPMAEPARTLVITGASSGIGRALSLAAAREAYRIVAVARRAERLSELAESIRAAGGSCVVLCGDVTARDMPARIVQEAMRAFGRIDALVNNAGGGAYGQLLEESDAEIERQWQVHVAAPLRLSRAALPALETTRGLLVFIGSGVARIPLPNYGAYSVAKAAIRAAAIQLRRELRSRGIGVMYVDPGVVATEFHSSIGIERTMKRAASPQQVARAMLRGISRRAAVVNAVPWQTAFSALGEWSGTLADPLIISRFRGRRAPVSSRAESRDAPYHPERSPQPCHPERSEAQRSGVEGANGNFETALEPVARRMERVNLSQAFLRDALVPGESIELNALAMRWAGMPNKNERAALHEVLDALERAGYLERMEDETWKVVRSAD